MNFEIQHESMVEHQLISRGIDDKNIISSFRKVQRHLFVPASMQNSAYADSPLSIGEGQTISQPYIVALMMQALDLQKTDSVLEIGTGSGYQTALLAEIVQKVCTIERIGALMIKAGKLLDDIGYRNIEYYSGDGSLGWNKAVKFEKIIVSAAAPDVPKKLVSQLKENGLMIIPTGNRMFQKLHLIKRKQGNLIFKDFGGCAFVPLIGKEGWKI